MGGVVTAVLGILAMAGLNLAGEQDSITDLVVLIGVVISGIFAFVGRVKGDKKIVK